MTEDDILALLTLVLAAERRPMNAADRVATAGAWAPALADIPAPDARAAWEWWLRDAGERKSSYFMPGDLRPYVKRVRETREREERIRRQAALPAGNGNRITLNRAEFERITQAALETARAERAAMTENRSK